MGGDLAFPLTLALCSAGRGIPEDEGICLGLVVNSVGNFLFNLELGRLISSGDGVIRPESGGDVATREI